MDIKHKNTNVAYLIDILDKQGFLALVEVTPSVRKGLGSVIDVVGTVKNNGITYLNTPNNCYMVDMFIKDYVKSLHKKYCK